MIATPLMSSWLDVVNAVLIVVASGAALLQLRQSFRAGRELRAFDTRARVDAVSSERERIERVFARGEGSDALALADIQRRFDSEQGLEDDLAAVLDALEMYCLAVSAGLSDEDIAFEMTNGTVVWYGTAFANYISDRRVKLDNPALYVYLAWIAERWRGRRASERHALEASRRPFFAR